MVFFAKVLGEVWRVFENFIRFFYSLQFVICTFLSPALAYYIHQYLRLVNMTYNSLCGTGQEDSDNGDSRVRHAIVIGGKK